MEAHHVQARPMRRGVLRLMLAAAAFGVGLLGLPGEAAARPWGDKPERWDGKWDTNWGNVRLFQDEGDIDGRWECNCPDGRKAVVNAVVFLFGPEPKEETLHGWWKCPGSEGPEGHGEFRIHADFAKKKRFRGRYWTNADRDNKVKWVGDKETG